MAGWLIVGLCLVCFSAGTFLGILIMCLCAVAGDADRRIEDS